MKRSADKHLFPVIVERDEAGFFIATNPAFPGCYSQGKSMEEALANVREATEVCLEDRPGAEISLPNISVHVITL
jgi:predicted RNase H-like HicB family nuclease